MPPSQVMSPRLQFAIGLTVKQISQCSGWQLAQQGVKSSKTKQFKAKTYKNFNGPMEGQESEKVGNQFRSKKPKVKTKAKIKAKFTCREEGEPIAGHQKKAAKDQLGGKSNYRRWSNVSSVVSRQKTSPTTSHGIRQRMKIKTKRHTQFIYTITSIFTIQDQQVSDRQECDGEVIGCLNMLTRKYQPGRRQCNSGEDRERLVTNHSL